MLKNKAVARVATANNFNCTPKEWQQVDEIAASGRDVFVNSNIRTKNVLSIRDHPYKAVITVNPDVDMPTDVNWRSIIRDLAGNLAFVRFKLTACNWSDFATVSTFCKSVGVNVVVTKMRFRRRETFERFIPEESRQCYEWSQPFWRLSKSYLDKFADKLGYICDKSGKGFPDCQLCDKLSYNTGNGVTSVNLSASGYCAFNCPDCFAKLVMARAHYTIAFDKIAKNGKQSGKIGTK